MQKLLCYDYHTFNRIMEENHWSDNSFPDNVAVISICSQNEDDNIHWFDSSKHPESVLNLDFDDVSPQQWWSNFKKDYYDNEDYYNSSAEFFKEGNMEEASKPFNYSYEDKLGDVVLLHSLDYSDAKKAVSFIDQNKDCDFYIHCAAGVSRSQAFVRYILDVFPDVEWDLNETNPCICPNIHVLRMLKRVKYLNL